MAIHPPADWSHLTQGFIARLALSIDHSLHMTSISEIEEVFALGGRLGPLERYVKRDLRHLLLVLNEWDAQRLFRLLSKPEHMDRQAFMELVAHEKLAARYMQWSWRAGVDKEFVRDLAVAPGVPRAARLWAKSRVESPRRITTQMYFQDEGKGRLLSREELYELVWSEPLHTLSGRFKLTDNGLRRRCRAMNVPTPPLGYWQQAKAGREVRPIPLPRL